MQDITFYNNIFQKYQTQEQLKKVKNLIINAIIQENQQQSFLDIIPYLEYASMKTYNTDINVPLEMERILELENKTHQMIDEWIK
jgi:methyl coenzyme M reductase alpha subunit